MKYEQLKVKLPAGFDPSRHADALIKKVSESHGDGWEIDHIDSGAGQAVLTRQGVLTEVSESEARTGSFEVRLAKGTKPSDADRVVTRLEDQHGPGVYVTKFEPFLGYAELTPLDDDTARCRGAVAVAIGVKPWEIQASPRRDGGFELELPKRYVPSKHDDKLMEVAESVVGEPGWYVKVDPKALTASIIPSDPPTFPNVFPTPLESLGQGDLDRTPIGHALPSPGVDVGPIVEIDWTDSAFALIAGTPGSGKSVLLSAVITDALSNGSALVIVDDMSKAVDFEWAKPFCMPGGWGCDSLGAAVAALGLVREEGSRRAKKLKQLGINNWLDMPAKDRFQPILVIVDEVSALLVPEPKMTGIPKDHPLAIEVAETNLAKAMLSNNITKILAELRFVGVRMVLSTQATNQNTGVGPSMRTKIGHLILQGTSPSKAARSQIFTDESGTPHVPDNVKASGTQSRGVGVATLEGQPPHVYKSYFASISDYEARLRELGVPTVKNPAPTSAQIDKFLPTLDETGSPSRSADDVERSPISGEPVADIAARVGDDTSWQYDPDTGEKLSGYALSNAARHKATVDAARANLCATCGTPVDPSTSECACSR